MGVDANPWLGLGFMLTKNNCSAGEFKEIYNDLLDRQEDYEAHSELTWITSDCYCGDWIFIGVSEHGSSEEIRQIQLGILGSNGDDIHLEVNTILGKEHPFLEHAKFGVFFGTDFT